MKERLTPARVYELQPALLKSLAVFDQAVRNGLEPKLLHLVKIRTSQINGCAFCQHMHAAEARHDDEQQERLDVVASWAEVGVFSERERAALRWAETLARLSQHPVQDEDYEAVAAHFNEQELVNLTGMIMAINAWNRLAIGFRFQPKFKAL
ncbi:MAG TPA: carboxymuconolactone decarboxylase family protein [Cellvibrio sp.]|nr:carboxymuconolactone decarboxylase family protein [Cellvibrio sp.]